MKYTLNWLITTCLFAAMIVCLAPAWVHGAKEIRLGELHGVEVFLIPGSKGESFSAVFKGGPEHKAVAIHSVGFDQPGEDMKGFYTSDPAVMWEFDDPYQGKGRDKTLIIVLPGYKKESTRNKSFLKTARLTMELAVLLKDGTVVDGALSREPSPSRSPALEESPPCGDHYEYLIKVDSMPLADILDIQRKFHEIALNEYNVEYWTAGEHVIENLKYYKNYPDYFEQRYWDNLATIKISFVQDGPESASDVRVSVHEGSSIIEGYSTDDGFTEKVDELGDRMLDLLSKKIAMYEKKRHRKVYKTYQPGVYCSEENPPL